MDYETDDSEHLTSAHLTTDGGQLSIVLDPDGIIFSVKGTFMHVDREDIGGIIDVLADFLAALEEVE